VGRVSQIRCPMAPATLRDLPVGVIMAAMVGRAVLVTLSLVMIAWVAVMLRDVRLAEAGRKTLFGTPTPTQAARAFDQLREAELLNPDTAPQVDRARYWIIQGRPRRTLAALNPVVADEPENYGAWTFLWGAAGAVDRPRAAEARAQILSLNPLVRFPALSRPPAPRPARAAGRERPRPGRSARRP
jgi:hypothetical protein